MYLAVLIAVTGLIFANDLGFNWHALIPPLMVWIMGMGAIEVVCKILGVAPPPPKPALIPPQFAIGAALLVFIAIFVYGEVVQPGNGMLLSMIPLLLILAFLAWIAFVTIPFMATNLSEKIRWIMGAKPEYSDDKSYVNKEKK
jgi:hypothetical protein